MTYEQWCEREGFTGIDTEVGKLARAAFEAGRAERPCNWTNPILLSIVAERHRQDIKWGEQNRPGLKWLAILVEEIGEASQALVESVIALHESPTASPNWDDQLEKELIQSAAVIVSWLECRARCPELR